MFNQVLAVFPALLVVSIARLGDGAAIDYNTSTAAGTFPAEDISPSTSIVTTDAERSSTSATPENATASNPSSSSKSTSDVYGTNATVHYTTEGHPTTSRTSNSSLCADEWLCPVETCACQNGGTCCEVDAGTPIARHICHCPYGYGGHSCDIERPTKASLMYSLWWVVVVSSGSLAFAVFRHKRQTKVRPHDPRERFVDVLNRPPQPSNNA